MRKPPYGSLTKGEPPPNGQTLIIIVYEDGTRHVLNWDEWAQWQADQLHELTLQSHVLHDFQPDVEH